jgi:hypothetical protein
MEPVTVLGSKLQLKSDDTIKLLGAPPDLVLDVPEAEDGDALLAFAVDAAALDAVQSTVVESAFADRLTWVAYLKAGRLGTDLNRDSVARRFRGTGVRPVRQVALDDVWSALRFRPGELPG